jgi:hypothetical protein
VAQEEKTTNPLMQDWACGWPSRPRPKEESERLIFFGANCQIQRPESHCREISWKFGFLAIFRFSSQRQIPAKANGEMLQGLIRRAFLQI